MKPYKIKILVFFIPGLLLLHSNAIAQSMANYSVSRTTGTSYTSIMPTGNVVAYWRTQDASTANLQDDNRSNFNPIGFDFWYDGIRYTYFNVSTNGFIDLSSSTADGNENSSAVLERVWEGCLGFTVGVWPYREEGAALSKSGGTMLALAPFYADITTGNGSANPIANSIRYLTTGSAPNRILTVEWKGFEDWFAPVGNFNFQVKLYETTGKIEFVYGSMTQGGSGCMWYACGLSSASVSGTPLASEILIQQTENTNSFGCVRQWNLFTVPSSNSTLTFTPPVPENPGSTLTFTSVGNTSMTLNWTDWSAMEDGYVIYMSTDGTNYFFYTQTAANTTSYAASSLYGTTYWWKVYAVTEGCLSNPVSGSQATLPAGNFVSVATGNWSNGATWNAGTVPTNGDNVTIANGHTVTMDGSYGCTNLTVGQGVSGTLLIGNSTTGQTVTILGNIIVNSGATFTPNSGFSATHTLTISGNISNNGTLNMRPNAGSLCNITFNKNGNQTISGTGATNGYNTIAISMGSSVSNTLEVTSSNFSAPSNFLTMNNGTFKFSVPSNAVTLDVFTAPVTIPLTCGLWMNSPNSTMYSHSTLYFKGDLTCSSGTLNVGDNADESMVSNGAILTITGGTVNIAGRITRPSYVAVTNFVMSGGTLNVNVKGSNDNVPYPGTVPAAPFTIDVVGSSFNMTGGTIIIRNPGNGSTAAYGYTNKNYTNYNFSGGTLQIGDGSTNPAIGGQSYYIDTDQPIANLVIDNTTNTKTGILSQALTVSKNATINSSSAFDCNSKNFTIGGTLTNNGSFTAGVNTVTFNGSLAQQIAGTTTSLVLNNFTISNTSGDVTTNNANITVAGTLNFTSGKLILGNNKITITSGNAITGFSSSSYVVTNGTGVLQINGISAARTFPIGLSTSSYTPIVNFTNTGTVDNYSARVISGVFRQGTTGNSVTTEVVNRTWLISEEIATGSNVTMSLQWNAVNETTGFTRNSSGITHYDGTLFSWDTPAYGASTGSDPYSISRAGLTAFSPFTVESSTHPLPIELLNFDAKLNANTMTDLTWETASETNNDYFTIERSTDAKNFEFVTTVKGAGTSNKIIDYSTVDKNPLKGISYYRLKQTDFDGKYAYSKIVPIELNAIGIQSVFPNPFNNNISIDCDIQNEGIINIDIFNNLGQQAYGTQEAAVKGINIFTVNSLNLPAGIYLLKITDMNGNVKTSTLNKN
jgi:hypothetical protein